MNPSEQCLKTGTALNIKVMNAKYVESETNLQISLSCASDCMSCDLEKKDYCLTCKYYGQVLLDGKC